MTSRLLGSRRRPAVPGSHSAHKGRDGVGFKTVVRNTAADHFAPKRRTFPGFNQPGCDLVCIEILPKITGTQAFGEGATPAFEDVNQLGANRLTETTELKEQVADQAAEQEIGGLVLVGQRMSMSTLFYWATLPLALGTVASIAVTVLYKANYHKKADTPAKFAVSQPT